MVFTEHVNTASSLLSTLSMQLEFCLWLLHTFSTMLEHGWPMWPGGASARSMQWPSQEYSQIWCHMGWAILVVLSWVCCYCHSRLLCPRKEVTFSLTKGQASTYLESPGKHIPTLLVTLSYIIKHETWGQGKINIRMHLSQQLLPTPCRVRQTIPSSNEHSFKEW